MGVFALHFLPSESKPVEDQCYLQVDGNAPIGSSYEFVKENALRVDDILAHTPYAENRYINADPTKIEGGVWLLDWEKRPLDAKQIADILNPQLEKVPGIHCMASPGASQSDKPVVNFILQTNQDFDYLEKYGNAFLSYLYTYYPGFTQVLTSLVPRQREYIIKIDREKAASLGVSTQDIANTIGYLVKGEKVGWVTRESKRDEMFIQIEESKRKTVDDLSEVLIKSRLNTNNRDKEDSRMVPVTDLITISENLAPTNLYHYNKMLSASAYGYLADGTSLGQAIEDLNQLKNTKLPSTIQLTFSGSTKNYLEESKLVIFIYGLALIFVFLILAAQFESFLDPLIIMFSVPFSITGALLALFLTDCTLNIYSKIGLVTLIGLITKHGILIVDFSNRARAAGKSPFEAVQEACFMRLRPILMTTLAMVIGSIPLALASGAGAAARRQIGVTIVGGMSVGTLFTLFVIPVIYLLFSGFRKINPDLYK